MSTIVHPQLQLDYASFSPSCLASHPPKQANRQWADYPAEQVECHWIDDVEGLHALAEGWKRLAECTLCPNVFYEPQLLIPAFEHLKEPGVRIAVVTSRPRANPKGDVVVCGVFPLKIIGMRLPRKIAKLWNHPLCFLTTPLIRADFAAETLESLIHFLRQEKIDVVMGQQVAAEGPFHHHLFEYLHRTGLGFAVNDVYRRALFVPQANAEAFLANWPRRKRHEVVRLERRLAESGTLRLEEFSLGDDPEAWCNQFLAFEALGWKGESRTAMQANAAQSACFHASIRNLAQENRFTGLVLRLDDEPIAMKVNFMTHQGGFGFKIAYDPQYAKYSPGLILEMHDVERMHRENRVQWIDSCAVPDHPMISSIWPERRLMQSFAFSTGGRLGHGLVASFPLIKALRRLVREASEACSSFVYRLRARKFFSKKVNHEPDHSC